MVVQQIYLLSRPEWEGG